MKVSIHLSKNSGPSGVRKEVVLDDLELDTALTISSALQGLEHADVEALIVVHEPRARPDGRPWQRALPDRTTGWFGKLLPRFATALAR
jgi:hypothetical protein